MHSNTTFASVKISLFQNNQLTVKSSIGLDEDFNITPLEYDVFKNNRAVLLKSFDETLPDECREKVKKYNITEIYSLPLRKEHYAKEAIGVISICTTEIKGLSEEEREMIEELAGDVGFAINSFHQKDAINHLSFYDLLTNLPNQKLFEKHLTQALTNSNNSKNYGAVLFFDFDNFKNVNDLMGKEAGDFILTNTADRLILTLNKASIISRYASDKFLILLENISSSEDEAAIIAEEFANEILLLTKEPFSIKEQFFYLTSSIGIVLFFDHNVNIDTLLNQAEYALRTAKSDGKNIIRFYNESLQNMTKSRSSMLQHLKEALLENQFFVNYQKQVDSDSKVTGVEALLRWQHPVMGLISPAQFIPLAEESGIIKELGAYVLREAANQLIAWKNNEIKKEWRISVNVSPLQFRDIDFVTNIKNLISSTSMNPTKLRVELTESVLIKNQEDAMQKIKELSKLGISVSIDDFGTGYSSLVYLKHLKINELKIDQSFVFGLETNSSDKTIIKTIIAMGEEFGFEVIAEGVETKEQFDMLKSLGCKYFQGYLFAKPCMAYEL
ncbi:MAG TPA: diguanylate cyclase [Sulfurimonas sp. UBA10385]|nr:MAG TPA: diguanylate cyclase [Sulfurimonas sp. UBA10385]